ncbi:MAG TPA: nitroreductase family deazaflavin-dependent oxidoreductase [Solirubrobacteraceae bacterium]|jgi:deazaflavin-dependent oxidoreductase (nitroreductase family)|nr:nitroreductase family deazaflavin-dependent oxidoreductase [Solirubrobacteraceae bacterium]
MDYLDLADRTWPLLRRAMSGHTAIYRATNGAIGHRVPGLGPTLLLDHVGAKSGARRTSPLVYGRDGANLVLVASKGGYPKNPAWFCNLQAHPDTTAQVGSDHLDVHARVAEGEERERLWALMVGVYGGYEDYQRRTDRKIPVVVLEPR